MPDDCPRPRSRLENALALLDPQSRQIMELWLQGATSGEIAMQLDLSPRAFEVMRSRVLFKVREFIAGQPPPPSPEEPEKTSS